MVILTWTIGSVYEEKFQMKYAERMVHLGTESAFEVLAKAKALEAKGRSIIHLEIGQPDFPTAVHICEAAHRAIQDGHTGYSPAAGIPELRQAIADHISQTRQVEISPAQTIVTPGAKPVIFFTLMALVNPGDEVIYPDPGFPAYASLIDFAGGKGVPLPLREENGFRFRLTDLVSAISDRTRLLILNSPHNPTGGLLTEEDLAAIAHLANRHDFYILSDEIYSRLIYEGVHHSIMEMPGMLDRTILLDGHSKTYAMTGWRLGYAVAPVPLVEQMTRLMINSNSCTCTFTQIAGIAALTGPQDSVLAMKAAFQERRDVLVAGLNAIDGVQCTQPAGAFYAFPNVTQLPLSSDQLADYLLDTAGVALLSGNAFGQWGQGYLRLSYANSLENIQAALGRIQLAFSQLQLLL
jgi:aspartate aminotransferase